MFMVGADFVILSPSPFVILNGVKNLKGGLKTGSEKNPCPEPFALCHSERTQGKLREGSGLRINSAKDLMSQRRILIKILRLTPQNDIHDSHLGEDYG